MPFKDTPDGSTHYYGDGCGEPEHNEEPKQEEKLHKRRVEAYLLLLFVVAVFFASFLFSLETIDSRLEQIENDLHSISGVTPPMTITMPCDIFFEVLSSEMSDGANFSNVHLVLTGDCPQYGQRPIVPPIY